VFLYLDDILIFSKSMVEHVCQVLQRLLAHHLFVKARKVWFSRSSDLLPGVHCISGLCTDGLPKGRSSGKLAAAQHGQTSSAFWGICSFLPKICEKL
jgi:hypothetical protein